MSSGKKKNAFLGTWIFLALVGGFTAWVYFSQYVGKQEKQEAEDKAAQLIPYPTAEIAAIEWSGADGKVRLEKKEDGLWHLTEPVRDLADVLSVDSITSALANEKSKAVAVQGSDIGWKTFGLDVPKFNLLVESKAKQSRRVRFGSVKAYDSSLYARIDEEPKVVVVGSTFESTLTKTAKEIRDKKLLPLKDRPTVTDLQIATNKGAVASAASYSTAATGGKIHLKKGKDQWEFEGGSAPKGWPVDEALIKSTIDTALDLRASEILDEENTKKEVLKKHKLDAPALTVNLAGTDSPASKPLKIALKFAPLGKEEFNGAALSSERPLVFSVYKTQIENLAKGELDFLDRKHPFQFSLSEVEGIRIKAAEGASASSSLLKKNAQWELAPESATRFAGRELDRAKVEELLSQLSKLEASQVIRPNGETKKVNLTSGQANAIDLVNAQGKTIFSFIYVKTPESEKKSLPAILAKTSRTGDLLLGLEANKVSGLPLESLLKQPPKDGQTSAPAEEPHEH